MKYLLHADSMGKHKSQHHLLRITRARRWTPSHKSQYSLIVSARGVIGSLDSGPLLTAEMFASR
ncbi:hypothetical protein OAF83_02045 [Rubripirellula sp.]|nr:hypothetical protein [Rubripirellula sp.]MDB4749664.1 hypothetical protein [Rubripirellula sp.]